MSASLNHPLRGAARRVIDDFLARARLARSRDDDTLAVFLELQARCLEGPLAVEEAAARQADEEQRTARLHITRWT